jgi:hypothetical protein
MYREGRGEGLWREWKSALPVPRGSWERIGLVYILQDKRQLFAIKQGNWDVP